MDAWFGFSIFLIGGFAGLLLGFLLSSWLNKLKPLKDARAEGLFSNMNHGKPPTDSLAVTNAEEEHFYEPTPGTEENSPAISSLPPSPNVSTHLLFSDKPALASPNHTQAFTGITQGSKNQNDAYQNLEQAVQARTQEIHTILEISKKIASTLELEPLLYLILDQIENILPFNGAAIFTLDGDRLQVAAYQVPGLPDLAEPISLNLEHARPCRLVIIEKKVVIVDDIKGETPLALAFRETSHFSGKLDFSYGRSWIGIPLIIRERVTGLLSLAHRNPGFYNQSHVRLAEAVSSQIAVALENAWLYDKAQNLATFQERQRIARELHDSVTQLLYSISLYCGATSRAIRSENYPQVEKNLAEIKNNALQALQEMRLLILELNPPLLQQAGLVAALQASLETIENRAGLAAEFIVEGVNRLPRNIETVLFRISMEALNNLVRYAQARQVKVVLASRSDWVFLEICDNGVGFDLEAAWKSGGMGLHNMEQRTRQLGGRFTINSQPGQGTQIIVEVPIYQNIRKTAESLEQKE